MKTQIIKFIEKEYEYVNLGDMTFPQFIALGSCLAAEETSNLERVRDLAKELCCPIHRRMDWKKMTVSLVMLKWEDVMILSAILADEVARLKTVPMNHWFREVSQFKKDHLSKILEALNLTFAARVDEFD